MNCSGKRFVGTHRISRKKEQKKSHKNMEERRRMIYEECKHSLFLPEKIILFIKRNRERIGIQVR